MVSASTLAHSSKLLHAGFAAFLLCLVVLACTSPTDLDVDRSKLYADGSSHPYRLSLYYYFGDSAYEAIVSDTSLLNTIWVEHGSTPHQITVPLFIFQLPDTIKASPAYTPFARSFSFSTNQLPMDGVFRHCVNRYSYIDGEYYDIDWNLVSFHWMADTLGRQLRMAWTEIENERIVKGSIQIALADPVEPRYVTYRALITIEY